MRVKKNRGFIKTSFKGIEIILKSELKLFIQGIFFSISHGLAWVLQVIFTQRFFDTVQQLVDNKVSYGHAVFALFGMILTYGFVQLMNGVDSCNANVLNLAMKKHANSYVFKKINQLGGTDFENSKQLDYINKAVKGGENLLFITMTLTDTLFFYTTYFVFMSWYLFTLKPILSISIVIIFIPSIFSYIIQISAFKNLEEDSAPLRRECKYYEKYATDIKEVRLLGANEFFKSLYQNSLRKINLLILKATVKKNSIGFIMEAITTVGYGVIIYMIVVLVMRQEISVGAFAAVIASVSALFNFMSEVISERLGWAFENVAAVENFLDFIEEEYPQKESAILDRDQDITMENISFRYPLMDENALEDINLTIKSGQTIAVVGENGSGKTTLCKVILGLYEPNSGNIYFENESSLNKKIKNFSTIFQNYNQYKFKLEDNIKISQVDKDASSDMIEGLCEKGGLHLDNETFTDGIQTMLGREFDGIELSGGQWQRIAIARGLFRTSDFIVLDEPTSAIDPLEESRIYQDFMKICENKTALIVTHRLGSVKLADRIIVLKDGRIVEDGTHFELIEQNGEYKRMFESQSKWYV